MVSRVPVRRRRIPQPPAAPVEPPRTAARRCSRPLCERDAEALLAFDYDSRHVELKWVDDEQDPNVLELCLVHADGFRAPQGWSVDDARQAVVELRTVMDAVGS